MYYGCWLAGSFGTGHLLYGWKLFLNITTWGMIILVTYLATAALSVTFKLFWENSCCSDSEPTEELCLNDLLDPPLSGWKCCCALGSGTLPWYLSLTWLLFTLASEVMVPVGLVYWITWDGTVVSWPVNIHEHGVSVLPGLVDLFMSGIPVRFLHFIYLMLFALVYALFNVFFWLAGGTDAEGNRYIYSIVNFEDSPLQASLILVIMVLILPLLVHSLYWCLYLLRVGILYCRLRNDPVEYIPRYQSEHCTMNEHTEIIDLPRIGPTENTDMVLSSLSRKPYRESVL